MQAFGYPPNIKIDITTSTNDSWDYSMNIQGKMFSGNTKSDDYNLLKMYLLGNQKKNALLKKADDTSTDKQLTLFLLLFKSFGDRLQSIFHLLDSQVSLVKSETILLTTCDGTIFSLMLQAGPTAALYYEKVSKKINSKITRFHTYQLIRSDKTPMNSLRLRCIARLKGCIISNESLIKSYNSISTNKSRYMLECLMGTYIFNNDSIVLIDLFFNVLKAMIIICNQNIRKCLTYLQSESVVGNCNDIDSMKSGENENDPDVKEYQSGMNTLIVELKKLTTLYIERYKVISFLTITKIMVGNYTKINISNYNTFLIGDTGETMKSVLLTTLATNTSTILPDGATNSRSIPDIMLFYKLLTKYSLTTPQHVSNKLGRADRYLSRQSIDPVPVKKGGTTNITVGGGRGYRDHPSLRTSIIDSDGNQKDIDRLNVTTSLNNYLLPEIENTIQNVLTGIDVADEVENIDTVSYKDTLDGKIDVIPFTYNESIDYNILLVEGEAADADIEAVAKEQAVAKATSEEAKEQAVAKATSEEAEEPAVAKATSEEAEEQAVAEATPTPVSSAEAEASAEAVLLDNKINSVIIEHISELNTTDIKTFISDFITTLRTYIHGIDNDTIYYTIRNYFVYKLENIEIKYNLKQVLLMNIVDHIYDVSYKGYSNTNHYYVLNLVEDYLHMTMHFADCDISTPIHNELLYGLIDSEQPEDVRNIISYYIEQDNYKEGFHEYMAKINNYMNPKLTFFLRRKDLYSKLNSIIQRIGNKTTEQDLVRVIEDLKELTNGITHGVTADEDAEDEREEPDGEGVDELIQSIMSDQTAEEAGADEAGAEEGPNVAYTVEDTVNDRNLLDKIDKLARVLSVRGVEELEGANYGGLQKKYTKRGKLNQRNKYTKRGKINKRNKYTKRGKINKRRRNTKRGKINKRRRNMKR